MDPIKDIKKACKTIDSKGHGKIRTKDGSVYSGLLFDMESPINDPEGIGYFLLKDKDGSIADIPYNEFDALVDAW